MTISADRKVLQQPDSGSKPVSREVFDLLNL